MQKLAQRTQQAERQVLRRIKVREDKQYRKDLRERINRAKGAVKDVNRNIFESRRARHEQWKLGPLAPDRRFVPHHNISEDQSRAGTEVTRWVYREHELEQRCKWAGGPKHLNLAVGDRVVLTEGRERGRIDKIKSIHKESGTIQLTDAGKIALQVPESMAGMEMSPGQYYPDVILAEQAIPISAVRLVHPLPDPVTGVTRDVIIRELKAVNFRHDRLTKITEWDRYVPGINVVLPWPEKEEEEARTYDSDTPRKLVHERTFVPTLLRPPMPDELVDELRGKFSRFRTRHEEWYLEKKEAEEAEKKKKVVFAKEMMTPVMELNVKRRAEKKAMGEPELSEEMLAKIGEVMARSKGLDLKAVEEQTRQEQEKEQADKPT